jgi:hypothetical protein
MKPQARWLLGAPLALAAACAGMIPSLAPGIHDNAVAYNTAISDINDRVLLTNIVRARDEVPLNITELSTVTGTLSEQASLGLAAPFGGNYGTTPRGTATTSVQLGTAPTFSMAALNTRGFTLNIIQPISPVYIASKWNTGISHELLLLLFVKDIQFADSFVASRADCAAQSGMPDPVAALAQAAEHQPLVACHHKFVNDPDAPGEEHAFKAVIEQMLPSVGLKVMTILEPVGPPFLFLPAGNTAASASGVTDKSTAAKGTAVATPLGAYDLARQLGDASYHIGNSDKLPGGGQMYRVYTNQVAVCASDPVKTSDGTFYIYPVGADISSARQSELAPAAAPRVAFDADQQARLEDFKAQCERAGRTGSHTCNAARSLKPQPSSQPGNSAFSSYAVVRSASGSGLNAGNEAGVDASSATQGRALLTTAVGGHAMPEVSASLQHNRVGALLRADDCYADQTIRDPITETEFHKYTETLGHIEWRSTAEVFQYLGAVLRKQGGVTWAVHKDRDIVGSSDSSLPDAMFVLRKADSAQGRAARIKADYGGESVAIGSGSVQLDGAGPVLNDQSLLVLSILSELVNAAKISSDIPGTQQLQVLP